MRERHRLVDVLAYANDRDYVGSCVFFQDKLVFEFVKKLWQNL